MEFILKAIRLHKICNVFKIVCNKQIKVQMVACRKFEIKMDLKRVKRILLTIFPCLNQVSKNDKPGFEVLIILQII